MAILLEVAGKVISLSEPEGQHLGYWIDVSSIPLSEADKTSWFQAFPYRKYTHPQYGEINITPEKAAQMAANVKSNIRGQDLDIDYDHKQFDGTAAGWIKDAEARGDALWLNVQWTPKAHEHLRNGEYKYFSPEYMDSWTHPVTNRTHENVLCGGALTNRPFLKGILPINLSELTENTGGNVDPKKLRQMLKLSETATDEEVQSAIDSQILADSKKKKDDAEDAVDNGVDDNTENADGTKKKKKVKATEIPDDLKKLADDNPAVKSLMDMVNAQQVQLTESNKLIGELSTANRLSEVKAQIGTLDTKDSALSPAVVTKLTEVMTDAPKPLSDSIFEVAKEMMDGVISLGERGSSNPNRKDDDAPGNEFLKKVDAARKEHEGMSFAEATTMVAGQEPQLYGEYVSGTYIKQKGA